MEAQIKKIKEKKRSTKKLVCIACSWKYSLKEPLKKYQTKLNISGNKEEDEESPLDWQEEDTLSKIFPEN